ncbi:MAG: inorganic phosphate transporter [Chitinophagaceae bacterium]|nr:inorganic phosphate transporter [Chitinophagaceae bacterium]MCB9047348.1 inorganic phosphate transporter [Chitinophagales bacterium]
MTVFLIIIIALALIFDFINGFHDAANSIATVVSTKVLTPFQAVVWAAFFNFVAFFIFKDHGVADTIAKTVKADFITLPVIISGLVAAIFWNLLTWWYGIPSSSSHTLIGGFAGAAIAHAGFNSINPEPVIKTVSFIVLAPLVGMIMAFIISLWFINAFRKSILPKLVSIGVIITMIFVLSNVLTTNTYELMGLKADKEKVVDHGVAIKDVGHKSPANLIKIKKGDVITAIGDIPVNNPKKLGNAFDNYHNGEQITVHVIRNNEEVTLQSTFDTGYSSRMWWVMFYGHNFKWILMAFVLFVMSVFTLFLSSLNVASSQRWFKRMQLVSSAIFSIGHGGNDAQKVMGIITAALIAGGTIESFDQMPVWVPLACYTAISLGTLSGGWKIIKTMGTRITKVTPFEGVAAETAGAITLFLTENLKIPVSTTHTITGAIIGVGATKRLSAVRWGVTINLLWAWILTIPVSGLMAAIIYFIFNLFL